MRQAEGRSTEIAGNAGSLSKRPLPSQKPPGLSPAGYEAPRFKAKCLCLSQKAPTSENGARNGVVWQQELRGTLRHAEGRSGNTAGNAGSLRTMSLPFQNPPELSRLDCKASGIGAVFLCLSRKAPTSENRAAGWRRWATGTQGNIEAGKGEKQRDHRECWEPPKRTSRISEAPSAVPGEL